MVSFILAKDSNRYSNAKFNKETLIQEIQLDSNVLNQVVENYINSNEKVIDSGELDSFKDYGEFNDANLDLIFKKYKLLTITIDEERKKLTFNLTGGNYTSNVWGFYFSGDDVPFGYVNTVLSDEDKFENGYREVMSYVYYTEKISDNWYYYEAGW